MREFLTSLVTALGQVGPAFLQVPSKTDYPYITLEPNQSFQGLPGGPMVMTFSIKIWSRYAGTQEILKLARGVEGLLEAYAPQTFKVSLKILESMLMPLTDGQTRLYIFRLRARLSGGHV